ncbi:MAG: hypothetical protein U0840_22780 [Gemmataceae bacterium]
MGHAVDDTLTLQRIPGKTAKEVASQADLHGPALALLKPEQSPREYLVALLQAEMYPQAIRFLAVGLPRREGIWWAALFLLWAGAGKLHSDDARALKAIMHWVIEPDEATRKATGEFMRTGVPSGHLARAVFNTGGSLNPPRYPVRPPNPQATPRAITSTITGVALQRGGASYTRYLRQAIALGMHIARGHYLWQCAPGPLPRPDLHRVLGS